jgi:hypothetical protein
MTIKQLFLSHHNDDARDVNEIAVELRMRGIVPWIDKHGGFKIGDDSPLEARRAIREDCFGLMLLASSKVFGSAFIRDIEIDEAIACREHDESFALFAVPRGMSFSEVAQRSKDVWGKDLARYHAVGINDDRTAADRRQVAREILRSVLSRVDAASIQPLSLQFSTRERMPDSVVDILRIDATGVFDNPNDRRPWNELLKALQDVKAEVSSRFGRTQLAVHGSKHLSAAFLFGRVFAPFALEIRQTPEHWWSSDIPPRGFMRPFESHTEEYAGNSGSLFVEIASGRKRVSNGVDQFMKSTGVRPRTRLQLVPVIRPLDVDNELCVSMVRQAYDEIEIALSRMNYSAVHLFVAAPQSFVMMLGQTFKGTPPVHLYEWSGAEYVPTALVPSGVL